MAEMNVRIDFDQAAFDQLRRLAEIGAAAVEHRAAVLSAMAPGLADVQLGRALSDPKLHELHRTRDELIGRYIAQHLPTVAALTRAGG